MKAACYLLLPLASRIIVGCGSTQPMEADPRLGTSPAPYAVRIVLPRAEERLEETGLAVDATRIEQAIRAEFQRQRVCTSVEVVTEAEPGAVGSMTSADIEVRVQPRRPPTFAFAGRTGWFLPNTLLWFFVGFPSFWVADRAYGIEWDVRLSLRSTSSREDIRELPLLLKEVRALSVIERGWGPAALYTPPGLFEGAETAQTLSSHVESWLVRELAQYVREESRTVPFGVEIAIESPANLCVATGPPFEARILLRSPRVLERISVALDGSPIYERNALNMVKAKRLSSGDHDPPQYEYDLRLPLKPPRGSHLLRVFALQKATPEIEARGAVEGWTATQTIQFTVPGPDVEESVRS